MTTQLQTVHITFPNTYVEVQSLEEVPVCPVSYSAAPVRVTSDAKTTWSPSGTVFQTLADGTSKIWTPRPTMAEAVDYRTTKRGFFQFHSNGAVTSRSYGSNWYWGPVKEAKPVNGEIEYSHQCEGDWTFDCCCGGTFCLCDTRPPRTPDPMFRYSFWSE